MDKHNKENNDNRLEEQQAPLKNTDQAFVRVGRSGEPEFPARTEEKEGAHNDNLKDPDRVTTIKHR